MVSPDVRRYVDLILIDKDQQDVFNTIIAKMKETLFNWEPREGNTEVVLAEGISVGVSEAVFAINRLPNAIFQVLIELFGVYRDSGQEPQVELRFQLSDDFGLVVPAGTTVNMTIPNNLGDINFITYEDLVIDEGDDFGSTVAYGDRYTADANNVAIGTAVEILDSLVQVDYVRTATLVTDGRSPEEDSDYFSRAVTRLQRLTSALVLPSHFVAAALEEPNIARALALDNYNGDADIDGDGPIGDDPGYITLAVYGDNEMVSHDNKHELMEVLQEQSVANLIVGFPIDPTITFFDVTGTVQIEPSMDSTDVVADIQTILQAAYDPMVWEWSDTVRRNELISRISNVPGVAYVATLTEPAADVVMTGVANLAQIGVIDIGIAE